MPLLQFPANNVANGKKAKLVYAICRRTGYGQLPDGGGPDPALWAWWSTASESGDHTHASFAAAVAHYDAVLTAVAKSDPLYQQNPLIAIYQHEVRRHRAETAQDVDL